MAACQRADGYIERRGGKMDFRDCYLAAVQEKSGK